MDICPLNLPYTPYKSLHPSVMLECWPAVGLWGVLLLLLFLDIYTPPRCAPARTRTRLSGVISGKSVISVRRPFESVTTQLLALHLGCKDV